MTITNSASGGVKATLRIEGLFVLVAGIVAYHLYGDGWGTYALFFFLPDVSFLGYLAGSKTGALFYNCAHSYIGSLMCLSIGLLLLSHIGVVIAIIWLSHIGFDRMLGYGLKYASGFHATHLGMIGKIKNKSN